MMSHRPWHKSSYSGSSGAECVEVAEGETVLVRDTRHRSHGHVQYPAAAWTAFLAEIKRDRP